MEQKSKSSDLVEDEDDPVLAQFLEKVNATMKPQKVHSKEWEELFQKKKEELLAKAKPVRRRNKATIMKEIRSQAANYADKEMERRALGQISSDLKSDETESSSNPKPTAKVTNSSRPARIHRQVPATSTPTLVPAKSTPDTKLPAKSVSNTQGSVKPTPGTQAPTKPNLILVVGKSTKSTPLSSTKSDTSVKSTIKQNPAPQLSSPPKQGPASKQGPAPKLSPVPQLSPAPKQGPRPKPTAAPTRIVIATKPKRPRQPKASEP